MQYSDVLIIGGGPAGSSLAWALRDQDLSVHILDKQSFPRDKTCAGWVTPAVLDVLKVDKLDYKRRHVLQPITGFRIGLMNQPALDNDHGPEIVSYGIRRCEFDHYLLQRVKATVETGVAVESLKRDGDCWIVNDQYTTKLLVGAGGHFCPVARILGAKLGHSEQVVAAKEVEFEMTPEQVKECAVKETIPELYFCEDLQGYAWVFRKGNFLNIGLGREDNHQLSDHLQRFVEDLQSQGRIPKDLPKRFKGHAYILYDHGQRQLVGEGVMLIGDSAGLAYTQSGEGIRPAVESALLAADCIRKAKGDYRAAQLQPYANALQKRFGIREKERLLKVNLPSALKQRVARALMQTQWFTRHVVTERWFLHQHQAGLVV